MIILNSGPNWHSCNAIDFYIKGVKIRLSAPVFHLFDKNLFHNKNLYLDGYLMDIIKSNNTINKSSLHFPHNFHKR